MVASQCWCGSVLLRHFINFENGGDNQIVNIPIYESKFEKMKSFVQDYKKHFKIYEDSILQSLHKLGIKDSQFEKIIKKPSYKNTILEEEFPNLNKNQKF